jgi:hypothetical protein
MSPALRRHEHLTREPPGFFSRRIVTLAVDDNHLVRPGNPGTIDTECHLVDFIPGWNHDSNAHWL